MANQTYLRILQAIELFASEHLQIQKFASDFPEQLPNFATKDEAYPILYVSPTSSTFNSNTNRYDLNVYCYDIIQKDRENINNILSDTNQILNDLSKWLKDGDIEGIDLINSPSVTPINNNLLDYVAGWQMTISLEVDSYSICEIPFNEQPAIIDIVNNIVYSNYLTCETLPECGVIINIENNLSGLTETVNDVVINLSGVTETVNEIEARLILKQNLPTGFITGLELSIVNSTTARIGTGAYIISDFSDLENILVELKQVTTPIDFTPQYLNTSPASYIALDSNMNVIQSESPFTNEDRRTLCIIGSVIHSNLTSINTTNEIKAPIVAPTNQLHDFLKAVGFLNLSGNVFGANGANLKLNKTAGTIWGFGINGSDYLNPHQLVLPELTALQFRYRTRNISVVPEGSYVTNIDPTNYDNGGVITAVPNNKFTIQHINIFQSGEVRIQYGQTIYNTLDQAKAGIALDPFVNEKNISDNAIFRAYLVIKRETTNLTTAIANGTAEFLPVSKFGNIQGGGAVSLTYQSIIDALGYIPENVANKTDVIGAGNSTNYPSTKGVVDYITTANGTWKKSGLSTNANLVNEKIYRQNNVGLIGNNVFYGTGPSQADIDNEILGTTFGHIQGGGTVPFIQLLSNSSNGASGTNNFIGRYVGAGNGNPQMNFTAIKSTSYDAWGGSGRVLFRWQDGYLVPQVKMDLGTDYLKLNSYPSTRNDSGSTVNNLLFTNSTGVLQSKPIGNVLESRNGTNSYFSDFLEQGDFRVNNAGYNAAQVYYGGTGNVNHPGQIIHYLDNITSIGLTFINFGHKEPNQVLDFVYMVDTTQSYLNSTIGCGINTGVIANDNAYYFHIIGNSVSAVTSNGGTKTSVLLGTLASGTIDSGSLYYHYRISVLTTNSIKFDIYQMNGTLLYTTTITTNIVPDLTNNMPIGVKTYITSGTPSITPVYMARYDYVSIKYNNIKQRGAI